MILLFLYHAYQVYPLHPVLSVVGMDVYDMQLDNPYSDQDFFGFFKVLFLRVWAFLSRQESLGNALTTDEVQMLVLISIAISGALVGTFLVLRRQAMIANALSHTMLLGIVIAYLLLHTLTIPVLMIAALVTGIATTFIIEFLTKKIKLQEDASIGLVFSLFFALGIVLLTLFSRNVHMGTELVMGNADALQKGDIKVVGVVLGINIVFFILFYRGWVITTFDSALGRTLGFSPLLFSYMLTIQTSITVIGGFRAVGVLMILAFLVLPPLIARLLTHRLALLIWIAIGSGSLAAILGVALSRHLLTYLGLGISTGGIIVMILGCFYILAIGHKMYSHFKLNRLYHG